MQLDNIEQLKKLLSDNGYSLTKARRVLFKLLKASEPQTVQQIQIKARGLENRVSVYRNLELFEKLGIVRRIYIGWKYKYELSDRFMAHHHHLTCLNCGMTVDIKDEKHIDDFISGVTSNFHFKPIRHQFEIEGICQNCVNEV
ncbi:MAG: Fur family transcriptional regulator [Candidatus Saccharimonadales bacterium]